MNKGWKNEQNFKTVANFLQQISKQLRETLNQANIE